MSDIVATPSREDPSAEFAPGSITFVDGRFIDDSMVSAIKRTVDHQISRTGILLESPKASTGSSTHRLAGRTLRFETFGLRTADRAGQSLHDPISAMFEAAPGMLASGPIDAGLLRSSRLPEAPAKDDELFFADYVELINDRARDLFETSFGADALAELLGRVAAGPLKRSALSPTESAILEVLVRLCVVHSFKSSDPTTLGAGPTVPVVVDPRLATYALITTGGDPNGCRWLDTASVAVDLYAHACVGEDPVDVTLSASPNSDSGPDLYVEHGHGIVAVRVDLTADPAEVVDFSMPEHMVVEEIQKVVLSNQQSVTGTGCLAVPASVLWEPLRAPERRD